MQSVLLISHAFRQLTGATKWLLASWTGQPLDRNVADYIETLICSSSTGQRNSLQLLECLHPSDVSIISYFSSLSQYSIALSCNFICLEDRI